jgi:hypothetical protein
MKNEAEPTPKTAMMRTNYLLWAIASTILFCLMGSTFDRGCGTYHTQSGKVCDTLFGWLASGDICQAAVELFVGEFFFAVLIGWAIQGIIVACLKTCSAR